MRLFISASNDLLDTEFEPMYTKSLNFGYPCLKQKYWWEKQMAGIHD